MRSRIRMGIPIIWVEKSEFEREKKKPKLVTALTEITASNKLTEITKHNCPN